MKKIGLVCLLALSLFVVACSSNESTTQSSTTQSSSQVSSEESTATLVKTASIKDGEHDVSGEVKIYDDNRLVIENFTYDGKAPDTSVSLGNINSSDEFEHQINLGEKLERAYDNETLTITLDSTIILSQFNAVSIWCESAREDFGSSKLA